MTKKTKPKVDQRRIQKVIKKINESGLKAGHIARKVGVSEVVLSYYRNNVPQYQTESMTTRLENFLETI